MRRQSYRYQRTIARPAKVQGVGYLTGATVQLCFRPAPASTGVVFVRTDLRPRAEVPARIEQVTGAQRRTTLGHPPAHVGLVEHVLAALAGLRIDNCYVELNAPEPPGLDGSAQPFVDLLREAGTVLQQARRSVWTVASTVLVAHQGATLALHPATGDELKISYLLDYGLGSPIGRQSHTQVITPQNFAAELAGSRTFILESEAAELRRQGLGARTTAADLLVFGPRGPIDNRVRYADEPARHKILDLVGDLALFGHDICGHLVAYRSGHPLNVELVRTLSRLVAQSRPTWRLAA
ncbi:MAG TPA: UDP-3-O-acyl-N-acetylglucosamine deacetylase [Gemmataceae bacterium]|nr:UDP-3-O-acyl-N-acetylglucosamine deacetylase [Gemmataceae bacterium]